MRHRVLTVLSMVLMLFAAVAGFGQVQQAFFPPSTTPIFLVDLWLPEGTDIRATDEYVVEIQQALGNDERYAFAHAVIGGGMPRFMLTYTPEAAYSSYAQLMFRAKDPEDLPADGRSGRFSRSALPRSDVKFKRLDIGPSPAAKIEARFIGPDPPSCGSSAVKAKAIMHDDPGQRVFAMTGGNAARCCGPN